MDDRALIYEINKILKMHGLDHGKREAAFGLLWIALHPKSKSTLTKTMCDDGRVRRFQRWTLSNNGCDTEMKVELT